MARAACRSWGLPLPRPFIGAPLRRDFFLSLRLTRGLRASQGITLPPPAAPQPFDQKVKSHLQAIFPHSHSSHAVLRGKCGAKCPIGLQSACMLKGDNK
jgi:hypothetical protein